MWKFVDIFVNVKRKRKEKLLCCALYDSAAAPFIQICGDNTTLTLPSLANILYEYETCTLLCIPFRIIKWFCFKNMLLYKIILSFSFLPLFWARDECCFCYHDYVGKAMSSTTVQ